MEHVKTVTQNPSAPAARSPAIGVTPIWEHHPPHPSEEIDTPALFKVTNKLLGKSEASPLPTCFSSAQLAEEFSRFFSYKGANIRQAFKNCVPRNIESNEYPSSKAKLSSIAPATIEEIKKIISKSPSKSCVLDPLPMGLLKSCLENQNIDQDISNAN